MQANLVHAASSATTMSSREIADLTGSSHDNVLKTIRSLRDRGVIAGNETPYTHPQNRQTYVEFHLNYRDTMVVVSGYSVELRARIIDRWQELEARDAAPALPNFSDPVAAARAWADAKESEQRAVAQLEQARPAVAFVERYVDASGSKGFREVCKLLKLNESEFRDFLIDRRVLYRLGGRLVPYQPHIDAGRFEIKAGVTTTEHAYNQTRFTPKGIAWVAGLWFSREGAAA